MTQTLLLLAGAWIGMGLTCWIVPTYASIKTEPLCLGDVLVAIMCLVMGPVAVWFYARHERDRLS